MEMFRKKTQRDDECNDLHGNEFNTTYKTQTSVHNCRDLPEKFSDVKLEESHNHITNTCLNSIQYAAILKTVQMMIFR